jgi:drug/metabolite transporter (DMT)-like permease
MLQVFILTVAFSLSTVISILLLGSRAIIAGDMNSLRVLQILFTWQFIFGALFALAARIFFMLINNALYKIPHLSQSSTTITTLITMVAVLFVIIANYFFLEERITPIQLIGALVIFAGIFLVTR